MSEDMVDADLEGIVAKRLGDAYTRSTFAGTVTRSVAGAPSCFASAAEATLDDGESGFA